MSKRLVVKQVGYAVRYVPANPRLTWSPEKNEYTTRPNLDRYLLNFQLRTPFLRKMAKAFHEADVPLLMGTDAGGVANIVPGFSTHDDLQELVDSGLTPYEALLAAPRRVLQSRGRIRNHRRRSPRRRHAARPLARGRRAHDDAGTDEELAFSPLKLYA